MPNRPRWLGQLLVPAVAVLLWQVLKSAGVLDFEYLPDPNEIVAALWQLLGSGELARDVAHTLRVVLLAVTISLTLGAALGVAIGLVGALRRNLLGSIDFLRTIPAVTLVPVAALTFGPSALAELLLAVYAALWPVVLSTAAGVAAVHPRQYDVAHMLQLSPAGTVGKIVMPAVVPALLVGARLSAVIALLVAIVAEMTMYQRGLGGGLIESLNALAPARMWAYALVCALIGYLLNAVLRLAVRRALPGSVANAQTGASVPAQPTATQPVAPVRGLLPIAVLLIVWQIAADTESLSFPPPTEWLTALGRLQAQGLLTPAITHTLSTYALGLTLATMIGSVLGVAIGASHGLDRAVSGSIDFIAAVPAAALVPVVVLLFGPTRLGSVTAVAVVVSWPILLNAASAMRSIPSVRLEMSRTLDLSALRRWRKVILPSLAPGILLGVRVASALALIATLLVDIFGTGEGVGRLLIESQQRFDASAAWGLLLIMGSIGYLTSGCLTWLGRSVGIPGSEPAAPGTGPVDFHPRAERLAR